MDEGHRTVTSQPSQQTATSETVVIEVGIVTAWGFLRDFPFCPWSVERTGKATNSEKRRWLQNKAVIINGERPGPDDSITYPITELVFFPKGKRKTTMM